jgi:hypothetical protein
MEHVVRRTRVRVAVLVLAFTVVGGPAFGADTDIGASYTRGANVIFTGGGGTVYVTAVEGVYAVGEGFPPGVATQHTGPRSQVCVYFSRTAGSTLYSGYGCKAVGSVIDPSLSVATIAADISTKIYRFTKRTDSCGRATYKAAGSSTSTIRILGVQIAAVSLPYFQDGLSIGASDKNLSVSNSVGGFTSQETTNRISAANSMGAGTYVDQRSRYDDGFGVAFSSGFSRSGLLLGGSVVVPSHGTLSTGTTYTILAAGINASLSYYE